MALGSLGLPMFTPVYQPPGGGWPNLPLGYVPVGMQISRTLNDGTQAPAVPATPMLGLWGIAFQSAASPQTGIVWQPPPNGLLGGSLIAQLVQLF